MFYFFCLREHQEYNCNSLSWIYSNHNLFIIKKSCPDWCRGNSTFIYCGAWCTQRALNKFKITQRHQFSISITLSEAAHPFGWLQWFRWSVTVKRLEKGGRKAHKYYFSRLQWIINGLIWVSASLYSRERSGWQIQQLFHYLPAKGCSQKHLIKHLLIVISKRNKIIKAITQTLYNKIW